MHKDKPPGIFDFADRSVGHAVGLGVTSGFLLSVVVHVGLLIWRAESDRPNLRRAGAEEAQRVMSAHRKPSSEVTPAPPPAVNY